MVNDIMAVKQMTTQGRARDIMGSNMVGIEEAIRYFESSRADGESYFLRDIPFSEATLWKCRQTHLLVAVLPISVLEIRSRVSFKMFCEKSWYDNTWFARQNGKASWQLIRKTPVPSSARKTWTEQRRLMSNHEDTPSAREMVYAVISNYLATGQRLLGDIYVRCSDVLTVTHRVSIGRFDSSGLDIEPDLCDDFFDNVGIACARKPDC